jgi:hypothetical protein
MTTTVRFADGTTEDLPERLAARVVGRDADGDLLVPLFPDQDDYLVPLTPCCHRDGKGGQRGIVCRGCYQPVECKYGGQSTLAVPVARTTGELAAAAQAARPSVDRRAFRVSEQWQARVSERDRKLIATIAPGLAEAIEDLA